MQILYLGPPEALRELALEFADRALALDETIPMLRVKAATLKRLGRPDEAAVASKRADSLEVKK